MGSLQQSVLGVFCIVAAFLFGQYVNNHPVQQPVAANQQAQGDTSATPFSFGTSSANSPVTADSSQSQQRLPDPSAGFGASSTPSVAVTPRDAGQNGIPNEQTQQPSAAAAPMVDTPDFSQLAESFDNTPLAIQNRQRPRSSQATPPARNNRTPFQQNITPPPLQAAAAPQNTGAPLSRQLTSRRVPNSRQSIGSQPEFVQPPQPMDAYELKEFASSFQQEDFQPQLATSRRSQPPTRPNRISLAPPEPDDSLLVPEVPDLEVKLPPENRSSNAANVDRTNGQIHSYYDPLTDRDSFSRQDFQRVSGSRTSTERVASRQSIDQPYRAAKPVSVMQSSDESPRTAKQPIRRQRVPFGLNEQGQNELARIRSRQQKSIDLQADRFEKYTTRAGDTLQRLSTQFYGKPDFYLDIYLANQNTLRNPVQIPAGVDLRIPIYE